MQVIFESRDADGAQMRDLSVERVRFALRRLTAAGAARQGAVLRRERPARWRRQTLPGRTEHRCRWHSGHCLAGPRLAHRAGPFTGSRNPGANAQPAAQPKTNADRTAKLALDS
jgi:hypothetical protein